MDDNIRAEFVATQLYDGLEGYSVKKSGAAYMGYCPDFLSVEPRLQTAELSRNGLMRMLPETLFFREDFLRSATTYDEKKNRIEILKRQKSNYETYFEAFDTLFFQQEVAIQREVDAVEENLDVLILREVYGIDVSRMRNPFLKSLALLLLDIDTLKGNIPMLTFCVKSILKEDVTSRVSARIQEDESPMAFRCVLFVINISHLSNEEYRSRMNQYEEFFQFLKHWFLPYDCEMDYCIKDRQQRFVLGESLTLGYNTQL